jgi:predicted neuraminidase
MAKFGQKGEHAVDKRRRRMAVLTSKQFLIPNPSESYSCHASTLIQLPSEDILVAWFAGSEEGASDTAIWGTRCVSGQWQDPFVLADAPQLPHWNPVLFRSQAGTVFLFYKVGPDPRSWQTMVRVSTDDGVSWSTPKELVGGNIGGRGPSKNKPVQLPDGTILAPGSSEQFLLPARRIQRWEAFVDRSQDGGTTWSRCAIPMNYEGLRGAAQFGAEGIIQPTLVYNGGEAIAFLRSTEGFVYRSRSVDAGIQWSVAQPLPLPHNNSGIDATLVEGTVYLVLNPVSDTSGSPPRTPLCVMASRDGGDTWQLVETLENAPGEYSYPAVVSRGSSLMLTYTWQRSNIVYSHLLLEGDDLDVI